MGSPALFQGNFVKFLKSKFNLFDVAYILTGTDDPRVTATLAPKGSLFMRQGTNGQVFFKLDDGTTTNWKMLLGEASNEFADELKETLKNYIENTYFDALVYNIPRIDGNGKLDGSSTATYDVTTDSFRFTAPAQTVVSTGLLDADFLASNRDVDSVQVVWQWVLGLIDAAATYEVSRDGGAHYQAVDMERISASNDTYQGVHDFVDETDPANQAFATTTTPVELTNVAGTNEQLAQRFELTAKTYMQQASLRLSKVDSGSLAGNYRLKLMGSQNVATPATYANAAASTGTQVIAVGAYAGQTFTTAATNPSYVNSVTVRLRNPTSNTEPEPVRLHLFATSAGSPVGNPIATADTIINVSDIPNVNTDYTFYFNSPVKLDPSTVYAWAIQAYNTAAPTIDMPVTNTDTFAGGQRFTINAANTVVTPTVGQDMTNFSVNYETRVYTPSDAVFAATDWLSASALPTVATETLIDANTYLDAGFYFVVAETDDDYKASFSTGVRAVRLHGITAGGNASAYREDGGVWASIAATQFAYNTYGTAVAPYISLHSIATWSGSGPLNATTNQAVAQRFEVSTVAKRITSVTFGVDRGGTPTGGLRIRVVNDSSGVPSTLAADTLYTSSYVDVSTLYDGNLTFDISNLTLAPGTYHVIVETDAAYKAQYTGLRNIQIRGQSIGSGGGEGSFNGTTWSNVPTENLTLTVTGRVLDLRLRVTSSVGSVETYGYGVFYDRPQGMIATGISNIELFSFTAGSQVDFVVTKFMPNPDLLVVYHAQTGQSWRYPAFDIQGQTITFPDNFFGNGGQGGVVTLIFDQTRGGAFDNSDRNALLLAANHLGSTDGTIDRSRAGRGIMLRSEDGTLYEAVIQNGGAGWDIYEVTP